MVIGNGETDLPEIVAARATPRRFAGRIDRRQQHRYQDSDDGDYDQKLNERKRFSALVLSTEKHLCFISRDAGGGSQHPRGGKCRDSSGHLNVTQTGYFSNSISL